MLKFLSLTWTNDAICSRLQVEYSFFHYPFSFQVTMQTLDPVHFKQIFLQLLYLKFNYSPTVLNLCHFVLEKVFPSSRETGDVLDGKYFVKKCLPGSEQFFGSVSFSNTEAISLLPQCSRSGCPSTIIPCPETRI